MKSVFLLALCALNAAWASSVVSSSSSSSDDVDDNSRSISTTADECVTCPAHRVRGKHCEKGYRRIVLERTCFTCMKEICIRKQIYKGEERLICKKNIPLCDCNDDETCVKVPRTDYRCQEAVCVPKIAGAEVIHDRLLR